MTTEACICIAAMCMTTCTCGTNQQLSMSEYGVDLEDEMLLSTGGGQLCELHQPLVDLSPGLELDYTLTVPSMSLSSLVLPSKTLPLTVTSSDDWLDDFLCETSLEFDQTSTSSLSSPDEEEDDFNFDCLLRTFSRDSGVSVGSSCVSSSSGHPLATLTSNTPQYPQSSGEHRHAAATSSSSHQQLTDLNSPISECGTALTGCSHRPSYLTSVVPWPHGTSLKHPSLHTSAASRGDMATVIIQYSSPIHIRLAVVSGRQQYDRTTRIIRLPPQFTWHCD
jgi:hypothetical protein